MYMQLANNHVVSMGGSCMHNYSYSYYSSLASLFAYYSYASKLHAYSCQMYNLR